MRRQFTVAFGLVGALASTAASALGLGTIRIDSRLNQPFAAEIPLLSVSAEQLETVRVRLADADEFRRLGIERADYLSELRFELLPGAAPVIRISSARPARDPFLTFLLDVRTDNQRVLREYTVLLDPPPDAVSRGTSPRAVAPVAAPTLAPFPPRAEPQPLPRATPAPTAAPTVATAPTPAATPRPAVVVSEGAMLPDAAATDASDRGTRYGPIQPQETLWSIANAVRPESASVNQTLLALYTANPTAFDRGRFDGLLRGVTLTVPPASVITEVDPVTARDRVLALRQAGSGPAAGAAVSRPPAATPMPTPRATPPPTPLPTAEATPAPTALPTRVEEDDVDAVGAVEGDAPPPAEVLEEDAAWTEDETDAGAETGVADLEADAAAATPADSAPVSRPQPPPSGGLLDALMLPLLLVLVAVAGGVAWWWSRRRRDTAAERSSAVAPPRAPVPPKKPAAPAAAAATGAAAATAATAAAADRSAQSLADEAEAAVMAAFAADAGAEGPSADAEAPTDFRFDAAEVETPADADPARELEATQIFQAPLLSTPKAVPDTPEFSSTGQFQVDAVQMDLGNQDPAAEADIHMAYGLYDEAELTLNTALAKDPHRPEWLFKLAEVQFAAGRGLAFAETAERAKPTLAAADWQKLALLGRQIAPENPLFAGADDAAAMAAEVDLSFEEPTPAAEPDRPAASASEGAVPPSLDVAELDVADLGMDAALDSNALEFNLDDFEVEGVPALELPNDVDATRPAPAADGGARDPSPVDDTPAAPAAADPGAMLDFDLELSPMTGPATHETAPPATTDSDPGNRLEFSLEDFDAPPAEAGPSSAGAEAPPEAARGDAIDFKLDSFDLDDSDTISSGDEAATKLDLARAYVDMGDAEMAQALLNEVLSEGSPQQQAEARELIARMA